MKHFAFHQVPSIKAQVSSWAAATLKLETCNLKLAATGRSI